LADVRAGKIDIVLVYKVDRAGRNAVAVDARFGQHEGYAATREAAMAAFARSRTSAMRSSISTSRPGAWLN
jgi:hypothetical protein